MTITLNGDSGITAPTYGGTVASEYSVPVTAFKNRIINGAMVIDQRNAGASVTPTDGQYLVDRFQAGLTQASKFTAQQNAGSVTPPAGFTNYLGVTSSSAYSILSTDVFCILQKIEGFNTADLAWGTVNAKTVTLSFRVYSSLIGTFGGALRNSANNRSYPFTYSVPVANTWTTISVTIAGDTSGTWLTTNGIGIQVIFGLGVGSTSSGTAGTWAGANYLSATGATSVVGTNGATFYITGVQLEKGSTATSFDYRPYGTELQLCQRYYQTWGGNGTYEMICSGYAYLPTAASPNGQMVTTMRSVPTMTYSSLAHFRIVRMGVTAQTPSTLVIDSNGSGLNSFSLSATCPSDVNLQYQMVYLTANGTTSMRFNLSAEL